MSQRSLSISWPSTVTPTFASNAPRPHQLQIDDVEKIPGILDEPEVDSSCARQITDIIICEKESDEEEGESVDEAEEAISSGQEPPSQNSTEFDEDANAEREAAFQAQETDRIGIGVAKLIDKVQSNGNGLESFQWTGPDPWSGHHDGGKRPAKFWQALWNSASTLESLNFEFYVHEPHLLHEAQDIPPCPTFSRLKRAYIDASHAHGNDGSFLDRWLRKCPALEVLDLRLPNCSLEECRIQGITWDYDLPALTTFGLDCYSSDHSQLSNFLHRNAAIETLTWDVRTDDPFILPASSFPNLKALSINFHGDAKLVSSIFLGLAQSPVVHARICGCPHDGYAEVVKVAASLRCLELDLSSRWQDASRTSADAEEETTEQNADADSPPLPKPPRIIKNLLPQIPELQELALDLETAYTTIYVDSGDSRKAQHPKAMDDSDLKLALRLLPPRTQIRALRMSDSRGVKLPAEFLANFPDVPLSLKYLKWDTAERAVLYRLERDGGQVRAVGCEPARASRMDGFWTQRRVLDFE